MRVFKPPRGIVLKSANCSSFLAEAKINGNFHKFSEKLDIIFDRRRGLSSYTSPCDRAIKDTFTSGCGQAVVGYIKIG